MQSERWTGGLALMMLGSVMLMAGSGARGQTAPAPADPDKAACVAALSPDARLIYDATAPAMTPGADLKETITAKTRELVIAGTIQKPNARPAAHEAAQCLRR